MMHQLLTIAVNQSETSEQLNRMPERFNKRIHHSPNVFCPLSGTIHSLWPCFSCSVTKNDHEMSDVLFKRNRS